MFLSRIVRLMKNYYFNGGQMKFSSLFINSIFLRRLEFALKIIVAFIIAGLIAYGSPLRHYLDQQYIICVISILSIQETVGSTLYSTIQTMISVIPLSIVLFLIQIFGLSYQHYLVAELLLLLLSLIIAYQCTQIQTRKITLLFNAIFFSTIVNEKVLPKMFVFLLLGLFLIGMFISIFVSLFIFPLFATIDIENRFSYCLKNIQQMSYLINRAFLSRDRMDAKILLSRSSILEQMIRQTMILMQSRISEARYEPSRFLQKVFYRRRKHIIHLTIEEEVKLVSLLMIDITSLQSMVNECRFNEYHNELINEMERSISYLNSCQSSVISSFISTKSISKDQFDYRLTNLSKAIETVRFSYKKIRLDRMPNVLRSRKSIQSDDHLSHAFFLFQLFHIVELLNIARTKEKNLSLINDQSKGSCFNECFVFQWSRLFLSLKSMIIIGVGSIFVMVPYLAKVFENGQWILIALCMTQADTVGGAFTTMKMRLIGTLLGVMWSYITYLLVHDNIFETFLMLIPWIFLFAYLRLFPKWGYTAAVASFTPILVNLGRLPYGDALPAGNYALLRIEENLVGILIAIILTMSIFPVYAIDSLKENIQKSLQSCGESVNSMHQVYDQLFAHQHFSNGVSIPLESEKQMKSFLDKQRSTFQQLINRQREFVVNASMEPTFFWFKNDFSSSRYNLIVQQQIDIFRILDNIDAALIDLSECSMKNTNELEDLKSRAADGLFLPNLRHELFDLSKQLNYCLQIWSNYFQLSQTRCYQLTRGLVPHRTQILQTDLIIHEECLRQLYQMIYRLQTEHQQGINRLFDHYFHRLNQGENLTTFVPYAHNEHADVILLGLSAMFYSITQLAHAALDLGMTIREVFELETTGLYQPF